MSESGLDRERYLLSDTESRRIFAERIVPTEFAGIAGVDRPVVHFFGGQPGAGKSVAQSAVTTAIIAADGIGAVASIIGDDFRPHHPAYNRLLAEDDEAAAFYTDLDSAAGSSKPSPGRSSAGRTSSSKAPSVDPRSPSRAPRTSRTRASRHTCMCWRSQVRQRYPHLRPLLRPAPR